MPRVISTAGSKARGRILDMTGDLIPEGDYFGTVRIADITEQPTKSEKNKGEPMYVVDLEFTEDPNKGRTLRTWVCLWADAIYALIQLNKSLGLQAVDSDGNALDHGIPEYMGQTPFGVRVKHELDAKNSTETNKIYRAVINSFLYPSTGGSRKVEDKEDVPLPSRGSKRGQ